MTIQYRTLQVIGTVMNNIQQGKVMTNLIGTMVILEAVCMNLCVKSKGSVDILAMGMVTLLLMVLLNFVWLGEISQVNTLSQEVRKVCRSSLVNKQRSDIKLQKRLIWSCDQVCVCFGFGNVVEKLTPLNTWMLVVNLTINLLLVKE